MSAGPSKLQFLESILKVNGVLVRYEKGNFNSGYCMLNDRKIAVINKFYKVPARLRILKEIVTKVPINPELITEEEMEVLGRLVPRWKEFELFENEISLSH